MVGVLLLVFVLLSVGYRAAMELRRGEVEADVPGKAAVAEVAVYFFDGGKDCATCEKLEAYAREAVETHFPEELASGVLVWLRRDMDEPENEHFVTDFELYAKSVVVVGLKDGERVRWENLEDIWELVYDRPAYIEYIRVRVGDFLGKAP